MRFNIRNNLSKLATLSEKQIKEAATMGLLHNGQWVDKWYPTAETAGEFKRMESSFRNWVSKDGTRPDLKTVATIYMYP